MDFSLDQLKKIMPRMARNPKTASLLFPHLQSAMLEAGITTKLRIAAFLAQVGHESGEFRFMEEIWGNAPTSAQMRYEPPSTLATRLGNTQKGDGFKFKGRGPIQLTGRDNYKKCGKALGVDLENYPEKAAEWDCGFRVAGWYWTTRNLNALADTGDFDGITKKINGGFNGKKERDSFYKLALSVL